MQGSLTRGKQPTQTTIKPNHFKRKVSTSKKKSPKNVLRQTVFQEDSFMKAPPTIKYKKKAESAIKKPKSRSPYELTPPKIKDENDPSPPLIAWKRDSKKHLAKSHIK